MFQELDNSIMQQKINTYAKKSEDSNFTDNDTNEIGKKVITEPQKRKKYLMKISSIRMAWVSLIKMRKVFQKI